MLPFLHNRNILMRSLNPEHEYFTTILRKSDDPSELRSARGSAAKGAVSNHYITMSISDLYVQVFSTHGFQSQRFTYEDIAKKYGKPKAVSNNGQFFIFAKKKTLKLTIMILTSNELYKVKEVDVEHDVKLYLENGVQQDQGVTQAKPLIDSILEGPASNFHDHTKWQYTMFINDNLDICIRFDPVNIF